MSQVVHGHMVILKCLRAHWKNFAKYQQYTLVKIITIHMCRCADVDIFIPCPQQVL